MGKLKIESSTGAKIFINDVDKGAITRGVKEYELESGDHEVHAKSAWCGSPKVNITIANDITSTLILDGFPNETLIRAAFMALAGLFVFTKSFIFAIIAGIVFLYPLYYITIGKDNYLQLSEKQSTPDKAE